MGKQQLTVFTPTYNRGYILPELKKSLDRQDDFSFEWLIVDDGSTDDTESIVSQWMEGTQRYDIRYYKVPNGGKPRAINLACELANSPWLFIVDSDDYLADSIIGFLLQQLTNIENDPTFVGIGALRGHDALTPKRNTPFSDSVDATNLDRPKYGLDIDCNEVYKIEILKQFPFEVWPDEIFTPEQVVLNEMALHGYKLRWFNKVIVISEYLDDGMTKGSWRLIARNPMGYALMHNHQLKYNQSCLLNINSIIQFIALICYAGNPSYIFKCNKPVIALFLFPFGLLLSYRRRRQLQRYI